MTFKFVLDSSFFKILENDVNYDNFFNAHAQVYVRRASLISMLVMQAHVKKKTFNAHAL
jgi:hypothetical protein